MKISVPNGKATFNGLNVAEISYESEQTSRSGEIC
jgi:hypothetical protein